MNSDDDIETIVHVGDHQRPEDSCAIFFFGKVAIQSTIVDRDVAFASHDTDTGNGRFSATGASEERNFRFVAGHEIRYAPVEKLTQRFTQNGGDFFRLLSLMRMGRFDEQFQFRHLLSTEAIARNHAAHGLK